MLTTNTGNREILANNGKEALCPEIENGSLKDTIYLQPNSKVKLLEGWTTNAVWLKRNPQVTQYQTVAPKIVTEAATPAPTVTNKGGK
jgi:hypothetical protein